MEEEQEMKETSDAFAEQSSEEAAIPQCEDGERRSESVGVAACEIDDPKLVGSPVISSSAEAIVSEKVPAVEPAAIAAIDAGDEILGEEADDMAVDVVGLAADAPRRGGRSWKRNRNRNRARSTVQRPRAKAPLKMKKGEEGLCFICFDGGDLVVCDRRGCPKVYHPECVNRDEAYFQAKGQWSCGWHICSNCQKSANYKCYTCTYSLCKGCIKEAKFSCIRGNEGLCEACMRMVMLIEKNEDANEKMIGIDFDDKSSWEYLFRDYWIDLKSKLSLTLEELTSDRTPSKGSNVVFDNEESSGDLDVGRDDQGASSHRFSGCCEKSFSSRRKVKKRLRKTADKEVSVKELEVEGTSIPEDIGWASKERKVKKRLTKTADKGGSVKEVPVEGTSIPEDIGWASKERKVKKRVRKTADKEGSIEEVVVEGTFIPEDSEWASKELLGFVEHMKDGDRSVLSQFDVQALLLEYIKRNNLRDRCRKSQIICDLRLQSLFGKSHVGHIEMLKLLESHFLIKEASPLITDDNQEGVVDPDPTQMDAEGISDASTRMTSEKRRKLRRMLEEKGPTNLDDYAAIDVHNINLMYLRRNLMENLIDDIDMFNEKVIGSFVRIRVSGSGQRHDVYRLVQVVGTGKAAEKYKTGKRTTDITLEILNLDKREAITIDIISNQAFNEEECKRLRQSIKCGFIGRLTVGEVREKTRVLQAVRVNDWLDSEKLRLGHLRDRASEKGRRKELRECVEKLQLLNTPEEHMRKLNEVPEIHVDPNMDPDFESAEDEGDSDDKRPDNCNSPRECSFKGREVISPGKGGSVSSNNWSAARKNSKNTTVAERTNDLSWNQGKDVYQTSSHETPKTEMNATGLGAGVQNNSQLVKNPGQLPGGPPETTPASQSVNVVGPSSTSENEKIWRYQDPSGKIQGPFSMTQLRKWSSNGYFPANLRIWRVSEKQEDSILLTDAVIGKFHNDLPQQEPQHNSTVQPTKDAAMMDARGNNWDGGWRGNNNPAWTDGKQNEANWKASQIDASFPAPQPSSLSAPKTGVVNPAEGRPAISSSGWESSNDPNAWSGQPQGFNSPRPITPFSGNTYQPPSYQGREGRGGRNTGRWNRGRGHQITLNTNKPQGLQPSGQGNERQHPYSSSSSQQFSGQLWQAQPSNDSSNQLGTDSFHLPTLTPQPSIRDCASVQGALNKVSPSIQPMCSGSGTAPRAIEAQPSLTATKEDNQKNNPCEAGAPIILGNQPPGISLPNVATVFSGSSSTELMGGLDKNQCLGSDCPNPTPKHEQAPSKVLNSEFSQPAHSRLNERGDHPVALLDELHPDSKSLGAHDRSASESRTITVDGGGSDPASKGDSLQLRSSASAEVAADIKPMVDADALEFVSAQTQQPDCSNVNPRPAENMPEQTRPQNKQLSLTSLEPCNSGKWEVASDTNSSQRSMPSLGSTARPGCEPAVDFTSVNRQNSQFVSCEPPPPNPLNAGTSTEAAQPLNTGWGAGANNVQNPGWAVAPHNPNPGPGGTSQDFGNMTCGTAIVGSANMGWGVVEQGTTNMAWGTPANLNMGWGPPAQVNTTANTGFGLLAPGNPNVNLAWVPPPQGNTNPNAGWGAPMQGNATLNPGWVAPTLGNTNQSANWGAPMQGIATPNPAWVAPSQGNANPNPGWVAPAMGNPNQNSSWGAPMQGTGQGMAWNPSAGNPNSWNAQQQTGDGHFSSGQGSGRHSSNSMQRSGGGGGPPRPPPRGQRGVCRFFQEYGHCRKGANCEYNHS